MTLTDFLLQELPSVYDLNSCEFLYNLKDSDPRVTGSIKDIVVITTIPQSVPRGETQSVWIVRPLTKPKVLKTPGYPAPLPKTRDDLYEIKSMPDVGKGVFAKRDISRGEIIFAERPLLVLPELQPSSQGSALLDLHRLLQTVPDHRKVYLRQPLHTYRPRARLIFQSPSKWLSTRSVWPSAWESND